MRSFRLFVFFASLCGLIVSCASTVPPQKSPDTAASPDNAVGKPPREDAPVEYSRAKVAQEILNSLQEGDNARALALFDSFSAEDRAAPDTVLLEASVLVSTGNTAAARPLVLSLTERDAGNLEARHVLATIQRAEGDAAAYQKTLEEIIKIDSSHVDSLAELGQIAWGKKIYKLADEYWTKALKADPGNLQSLLGKARVRLRAEDPDGAERYLNTAIASWPELPEPYAERSRLYKAYDLYKDALSDQNKALELDPDNYWYLLDRARILVDLGRKQEALSDLETAQRIDPETFLSYVYSAGIHDEYGNYEKAERDYSILARLKPEYYFAFEALGVLALREERWADAADAFIHGLKEAPDHYHYALLAGLAMRKGGRDKDARSFLEGVLKQVPRDKIDWQLLRLFHDMSGDVDIAVRIDRESGNEVKARMLYYLAQFYSIKDAKTLALKYHLQVRDMNVQTIVEWRLNEWAIAKLEKQ